MLSYTSGVLGKLYYSYINNTLYIAIHLGMNMVKDTNLNIQNLLSLRY